MATSFFGGAFFGGEFFNGSTPAVQRPGTIISFLASRGIDWAEVERIKLEKALARKKKELKKLEKKIKVVEKKVEKEPTKGILANLHLLEKKADEVAVEIADLQVNLMGILDFLGKLEFDDDDDDLFLLL